MSVTTAAVPVKPMIATTTVSVKPLVTAGLAAAAIAAAATAAVAAVGEFAGISLDIAGKPIPLFAFAFLTAIFSVAGLVLAAVLARMVRRPRMVFVRTTVALTALSLVPDIIADATAPTKALLMLTHVVAAAIVIPAIARRLSV